MLARCHNCPKSSALSIAPLLQQQHQKRQQDDSWAQQLWWSPRKLCHPLLGFLNHVLNCWIPLSHLFWMALTLATRSTWPALYCSSTSFTSYGFRASLNLRLATLYFICTDFVTTSRSGPIFIDMIKHMRSSNAAMEVTDSPNLVQGFYIKKLGQVVVEVAICRRA